VSLWNVEGYVRLRHGGDDNALELYAERHVVPGTRVLEVGCGPGRAAAALAGRHGAHVTAVDVSPEMLAAARSIVPASVELVEAPAEELPFADGAFDAALTNFAVHLFDRPRAFAEIRRVLAGGAPYWIKTADPERIADHWAAPLFPSFVELEVERFPTEDDLRRELESAGFTVAAERLSTTEELSREAAIARLTGGTFSTLALLPPDERDAGIARAREVLPDPVRYAGTLLVVTATA
jgi:ubiquinone/menaquinone biosynthesis C-methylase UbiE